MLNKNRSESEESGMKTMKLKDLGRGSLFEYGGIEWVLLDHGEGRELCISAEKALREAGI